MPVNYPNNPTVGQEFSLPIGTVMKWDGEKWKSMPNADGNLRSQLAANGGAELVNFGQIREEANATGMAITAEINLLIRQNHGIIPVETFREASVTDTATVIAAFAAAQHGQMVRFEAGRTYVLTERIIVDLTTRTLYVDLNGCILEFTDGRHGIVFKSDWATIQSFGSLRSDGLAIQDVSNPTTFIPKNYVRIISDNLAPDARASGAFQCEDIYLESISGSTLTFMRQSGFIYGRQANYTTNARVCQRTGNRVVMMNGIVRHPESATIPSWQSNNLIEAVALVNPIFYNISSPRAVLPTLELKACINGVIYGGVDGKHDDLAWPGDVDTYGYGFRDCSLHTKVIGRAAYRCRHAIDTHEQNYGSNQSPELYGSSVGMRVLVCSAVGTTGSSFTAHHQAKGLKFIGCIAQDCFEAGYGLRGEVELHGCESYRCRQDIHAFDEDNANPARVSVRVYDHTARMSGVVRNDCRGIAIDLWDYTWIDGHLQQSILCENTHELATTRFHGKTYVRPSRQAIVGQALFGVNVKGAVEFDEMIWDLNVVFSSYVRAIDCRAPGAPNNVFTLKGNLLRVLGAGVNTFFNADLTYPPTPGLMRFNLVFDAGVPTWTGGTQNNQTNIQVARDNNVAALSSVTVLNPDNQFGSQLGQVREVTLSFGSVLSGAEAFTDFFVFGFALNTPALVQAITLDNRIVVEKCVMVSDGGARVYIRNRTGATEVLDNIVFTMLAAKL